MRYVGYLRVSRATSAVNTLRADLVAYATARAFGPLDFVIDATTKATPWQDCALGALLASRASAGDVILTPDFKYLAGDAGQVFEVIAAAATRGVAITITSSCTSIDFPLHPELVASSFTLAASVRRAFLPARSRAPGAPSTVARGGRPAGTLGPLKLDSQLERVEELLRLKTSARKMASIFRVTEKTMRKFLARHFPPGKP